MPLHYVLSEIAICIAAIWGARSLWLNRQSLGSVGVMFYGLAALIGIIRIVSGADEVFAPAHRLVSQAGGVVGLVLIVSEIARLRGLKLPLWAVLISAGFATWAALKGAEWGALVFLGLLATGAILLAMHGGGKRKTFLAIWFAVMAPNILFVRQSPVLDPAASWHAYHLIIAVWLIAVIAGLKQTQTGSLNRALSA
jgi:hypothetical protein